MQNALGSLDPHQSVVSILEEPLRLLFHMGAEERKQRCLELLDMARLERDTLRPVSYTHLIAIVVYLFVLDWRMALVSLITIPVGMLCYMAQMQELSLIHIWIYTFTYQLESSSQSHKPGGEKVARWSRNVLPDVIWYIRWLANANQKGGQ